MPGNRRAGDRTTVRRDGGIERLGCFRQAQCEQCRPAEQDDCDDGGDGDQHTLSAARRFGTLRRRLVCRVFSGRQVRLCLRLLFAAAFGGCGGLLFGRGLLLLRRRVGVFLVGSRSFRLVGVRYLVEILVIVGIVRCRHIETPHAKRLGKRYAKTAGNTNLLACW